MDHQELHACLIKINEIGRRHEFDWHFHKSFVQSSYGHTATIQVTLRPSMNGKYAELLEYLRFVRGFVTTLHHQSPISQPISQAQHPTTTSHQMLCALDERIGNFIRIAQEHPGVLRILEEDESHAPGSVPFQFKERALEQYQGYDIPYTTYCPNDRDMDLIHEWMILWSKVPVEGQFLTVSTHPQGMRLYVQISDEHHRGNITAQIVPKQDLQAYIDSTPALIEQALQDMQLQDKHILQTKTEEFRVPSLTKH